MKGPETIGMPRVAKSETGTTGLRKFIESIAAEYQKESLPIGADGRIMMSAYKGIYLNVDADINRTAEWRKNDDSERLGEQLEMLAYAIFHKNLRSRFVVARASHHDDQVKKVDTILFDRETGNLVCAFDEVGDAGGIRYEGKKNDVLDRNLKDGGASLKYSLALKETDGKKEITLGNSEHIPIFYIALPKTEIEQGVREFNPSLTEQSDFEKKLFEYFIAAISLQIQALELGGGLDLNLKRKLDDFKNVVEGLKKK